VIVDGSLLFSKHQLDRFPKESEVIDKLGELRQ
jgi:hypothetical protein